MNNPPQRGGFSNTALTTTGDSSCGEQTSPCGSKVPDSIADFNFTGGGLFKVSVVLNQQHLNNTLPGSIELSYCYSDCTDELSFLPIPSCSFEDSAVLATPVLIIFNLTLPNPPALSPITLRVTYTTDTEAGTYVMCSDGYIVNSINAAADGNCTSLPTTVNATTAIPTVGASTTGTVSSTGTSTQAQNDDSKSSGILLGYGLPIVAGVGAAIVVIIILIIIIIIVVVVKKKKSSSSSGYAGSFSSSTDAPSNGAPIPIVSMHQIQTQLMSSVQDDDQSQRQQPYQQQTY